MSLRLQGTSSGLRLFRILPGGHVSRLGIEEEGSGVEPLRLHRRSQLGYNLGCGSADLCNHGEFSYGVYEGTQFVNGSHRRIQVSDTVGFLSNMNNRLLVLLGGLARNLRVDLELSSVAKPANMFICDFVRSQDWDLWDQPFCNNVRLAAFSRFSR